MELALQFGYGMMDHCRSLLKNWGGGTVVLSPRDLEPDRLVSFASELHKLKGTRLLDPQLYVPDCDHARLTGHSFWPKSAEYWKNPAELSRVAEQLLKLNNDVGSSQIICPMPLASTVNADSLAPVTAAIGAFVALGVPSARMLATVALTSDAVRNEDRAEELADAIESWQVAGIYLVAEPPSGEYLVTDPMWLGRILDIVAGARLVGKTVILGYCTHQMLLAATAGANTVASGIWMNVRRFSADKFGEPDPDDVSRRARWYYAPDLLSEYKILTLDLARKLGLLSELRTPAGLDGGFATPLFSGSQPSSVDFSEQTAFRHYLHALREQVAAASRPTFLETCQEHEQTLARAEAGLSKLRKKSITGQERDFWDALPANRGAVQLLTASRGPILSRMWKSL